MFEYGVADYYGRLVFTGSLSDCDEYMMNVYRIKGRDSYYKLSLQYQGA